MKHRYILRAAIGLVTATAAYWFIAVLIRRPIGGGVEPSLQGPAQKVTTTKVVNASQNGEIRVDPPPTRMPNARVKKMLDRVAVLGKLYVPPILDRKLVLAYLDRFPNDPKIRVWASIALEDANLLPAGETPFEQWGRIYFGLRAGKGKVTPELSETVRQWQLAEPDNALPKLLLALGLLQADDLVGGLRLIKQSEGMAVNDYTEDVHQATRGYLAESGASASEQLRFQLQYPGAEKYLNALATSLSRLQTPSQSAEDSDIRAARLQLASLDYSPTGIIRLDNNLQSESYSAQKLGENLMKYMPNGSSQEAADYRNQVSSNRMAVDVLYDLRSYIYEKAPNEIAIAFLASRNAVGEVPALIEWYHRPEVNEVVARLRTNLPEKPN